MGIRKQQLSRSLVSWIEGQVGLGPGVGDIFFLASSATGAPYLWLREQGVDSDHLKITWATAYAALTAGRNDVLIVMPGSYTQTAAITWAKDYTHLIGAVAPVNCGARAVIQTSTTAISPFMTFSGDGCIVKNVMFSHAGSHGTNCAVNFALSGDRNYFENVTLRSIGALTVPGTGQRDLKITSSNGENHWKNCHIGYSSVDGDSGDPMNIEYAGTETARDIYEDCLIEGKGAASGAFLKVGNGATTAVTLFKRCTFFNNDLGTMDAMTQGFIIGSGNGIILLQDSPTYGATAYETSDSGCLLSNTGAGSATGNKFVAYTG